MIEKLDVRKKGYLKIHVAADVKTKKKNSFGDEDNPMSMSTIAEHYQN